MVKSRISAPSIALSIGAMILGSACAITKAQSAPAFAAIARTVNSPLQWGPCPEIFPAGCKIAVLNGDPSKPNADVFLRVPAGYKIPAHSHTSAERMILVEGLLTVRYEGTLAAVLRPGAYAYGPAGLPHEARCGSKRRCTLFIAFEGPVDAHPHASVEK